MDCLQKEASSQTGTMMTMARAFRKGFDSVCRTSSTGRLWIERTGRGVFSLLCISLLLGCSPDLDSTTWTCESSTDCGDGWVCDKIQSLCIEAWEDRNGVYSDRIVLGTTLMLTGDLQEIGKSFSTGMKAYFSHINSTGGIHGRTIDFRIKDDAYMPDQALANVKAFLEGKASDRAFAIVGPLGTPTSAVTHPYVNDQKKTLFFGALTGADFLRKNPPDRYTFNFRASYASEAASFANYMTTYRDEGLLQPDQIAVFAQAAVREQPADPLVTDAYGQQGLNGVLQQLDASEEELTIAHYEKGSADTKDATEEILQWLANASWVQQATEETPVEAGLIMVGVPDPTANVIKELRDALATVRLDGTLPTYGLTEEEECAPLKNVSDIVFTTISPGGSEITQGILEGFGKYTTVVGGEEVELSYTEGVIFASIVPAPWSSASGVLQYISHLKSYDSNAVAGFFSLEGYLVARLFCEGLEENGKDITIETLVDTFESMSQIELGIGATLGFGPNDHEGSSFVWAFELSALNENNKAEWIEVMINE